MRRGHLNAEEPLGTLGETHSVGRRKCFMLGTSCFTSMTQHLATPQRHRLPQSPIGPKQPIHITPWTTGPRNRCLTLTLTSIRTFLD